MNKLTQLKVLCGLSLCIILIGGFSIDYTYNTFPTYIPPYGGGESFELDHYNNFTSLFRFDVVYQLNISIETDGPVEIYVSNTEEYLGPYTKIYNGTSLTTTIVPDRVIYMKIVSNTRVKGFMSLKQEIPLSLKIISIGTTGMGALAFIIFSIYWRKHISIKSEKKFSNNDK